MAIEDIKTINYTPRPIVRKDINSFARGMEQLTARHKEAILQRSAVDDVFSKLELNPAEDEWKFNYAQQVKSKIDDAAQLGNYAGALSTAITAGRESINNPALLGRLRANINYKKYQEELDNANINTDVKDYYKELNPYKYEDKYDDKGNIVGGTDWQPEARPVATVDMYKVMQTALQNTAKESGGGNTIYFMDKTGNYTTDINKSVDGLPYISKGNKYESLSKDKLRKSIEAAINATPGAAESVEQDYKVGVWKTNKQLSASTDEKPVITEVTDNKGMLLTKEQYLDKMINPFVQSATYTHNFSSTDALQGLSTGAAKLRAQLGGDTKKVTASDLQGAKAGYYEKQANAANSLYAQKNASRQGLTQIATQMGVIVKPSASGESIYNAIKIKAQRDKTVIPKAAIDVYNVWKESNRLFNESLPQGIDGDKKQAIEFKTALDNNVDLSQLGDNKYAKEYIKRINEVWGNDGEQLKFRIAPGTLRSIMAELDGTHNGSHRELGVSTDTDNNGNIYITLNRSHAFNQQFVGNIVDKYKAGIIDKFMINQRPSYSFDALVVDKNGIAKPIIMLNDAVSGRKIYNKADDIAKTVIGDNSNTKPVNVPQNALGLKDITYQYGINNGLKSDQLKVIDDKIDAALGSYQAQMGEMYLGTTGNTRKAVANGMERAETWATLNAIKATNPNRISYAIDDKTLGLIVTVAPDIKSEANTEKISKSGDIKIKTNEGFSLYVPNALSSEIKTMILNNPTVKAKNKLYESVISGIGITPIGDNASLISNDGINYTYKTKHGARELNEEQAANVLLNKQYLDDLRYSVYSAGGKNAINEKQGAAIVNNIISNYRKIYDLGDIPFDKFPNDIVNQIKSDIEDVTKPY